MKMTDFRRLVKSTKPCDTGWEWFLKETKGKTVKQFFDKLKNIKEDYGVYSEHAYLIYIFRTCLDWWNSIGIESNYCIILDYEYQIFITNIFNVSNDRNIPIPLLCDILSEAFGDNYEEYI